MDVEDLPTWAEWLGHALPLFYANTVIQEVIKDNGSLQEVWGNLVILAGYGVALLLVASRTLREVE
jgi:ABC-2 type transport system permease protein